MMRWLATASVLGTFVASMCPSPTAKADVFVMCPDGHEGVVGEHTSCPFARNVHDWGGPHVGGQKRKN
jgi:hypothetical protein